ncbi:hypothetical protein QJQ45_029442, partial [Haematococcus lacustris]
DFALEPDEGRMRKAAHLMVSSLAGSLALVTCKDPLRVALTATLRALLTNQLPSANDAGVVEQVAAVVCNDNLDLGCAIIERAATDKAVRDVDKLLAGAYEERSKARAQGKSFVDPLALQGRFPRELPESLRPRPGVVSAMQLRVYEDFARIPRTAPPTPAPNTLPPPGAPGAAAQQQTGGQGTTPRPYGFGADQGGGPGAESGGMGQRAPDTQALSQLPVASASYLDSYLLWQGHADAAISKVEAQGGAAPGEREVAAELQALQGELVEAVRGAGQPLEAATFFGLRIFRHLLESASVGLGGAGLTAKIHPALSPRGTQVAATFFVGCLRGLADLVSSDLRLTAAWAAIDDERKFAVQPVEALLLARLLALPEVDSSLARALLVGRSQAALELVLHLTKACVLRDHTLGYQLLWCCVPLPVLLLLLVLLVLQELMNCIEALFKVSVAARSTSLAVVPPTAATTAALAAAESHMGLVEQARKLGAASITSNRPAAVIPGKATGRGRGWEWVKAALRNDKLDPPGLSQQSLAMFEEWLRLTSGWPLGITAAAASPQPALSPASLPGAGGAPGTGGAMPGVVTEADRAGVTAFLTMLRGMGVFKDDSLLDKWLRCCLDLAIAHANTLMAAAEPGGRPTEPGSIFMAVDALARLLAGVVVAGGGDLFLRRALAALVACLLRDHDERTSSFNGRPYMRLLVSLMAELPGGSGGSADTQDQVALRYLRSIGSVALHELQPLSVPGFAFCWLELLSHRNFMPRLLLAPQGQGWQLFEGLLLDLLRFLEPHLRTAELVEGVRALYKGTLRLLLVLLHDFPEFLCEHHFPLCDTIPPSCVQLRNLILSAFPRAMRLPDPFTPNLKVDLLPEISHAPRLALGLDALLPEPLRSAVDTYLRSRTPPSFPQDLTKRLALPPSDGKASSPAYNASTIHALVLYVGARTCTTTSPLNGPAMDIFSRLVSEPDSELRHCVLNAVANQLRYPNAHTHYFSCVLLNLFAEVKVDQVKEQVTRTLLERLIVNRPHPWGLLITFLELIKNPRYAFWTYEFTRCAPEIERLFKSVASSCIHPGASAGAGGAGGGGGAAGAGAGGPNAAQQSGQAAAQEEGGEGSMAGGAGGEGQSGGGAPGVNLEATVRA